MNMINIEEERKKYIVLEDNTNIITTSGRRYIATKELWMNIGMFQDFYLLKRERTLRKEGIHLICNKMSIISINNKEVVELKVGEHKYHKIPNWKWLGLSYIPFDNYSLSASLEYDTIIKVNIKDNIHLIEHIKNIDEWSELI